MLGKAASMGCVLSRVVCGQQCGDYSTVRTSAVTISTQRIICSNIPFINVVDKKIEIVCQ